MKLKTGFAKVNNTKLYYEIAGTGNTLVLIHGSSTDTRMWDDQLEAFTKHFQVLRYDMRGHGQSDTPTNKTYTHAADLNALLEYLKIFNVHVAGLSSGGHTAIDFALLYPNKTSSLIPISAIPTGWRNQTENKNSMTEIDEAIKTAFHTSGKRAATKLVYTHPVFNTAIMNPLSSVRMKQYLDEANWWRMLRKDPGKFEEPSQVKRLTEILVPTLVIVGDLDIPEMKPASEDIVKRIKGATKVSLSQCGHMVNMENPKKFNKILLDFVKSI